MNSIMNIIFFVFLSGDASISTKKPKDGFVLITTKKFALKRTKPPEKAIVCLL